MIGLEFEPWRPFHATGDKAELQRWLHAVGQAGTEAFRSGMGQYPPASAPGAWPNSRSGRLKGSIRYTVANDTVTISTNMPYSGFLRSGTRKMARRKMSDNAMEEGERAAGRLKNWAHWAPG